MPVENSTIRDLERLLALHDAFEELPREEALARLYELRSAYGSVAALDFAATVTARHRARFGHDLCSGCCADGDASALRESF